MGKCGPPFVPHQKCYVQPWWESSSNESPGVGGNSKILHQRNHTVLSVICTYLCVICGSFSADTKFNTSPVSDSRNALSRGSIYPTVDRWVGTPITRWFGRGFPIYNLQPLAIVVWHLGGSKGHVMWAGTYWWLSHPPHPYNIRRCQLRE